MCLSSTKGQKSTAYYIKRQVRNSRDFGNPRGLGAPSRSLGSSIGTCGSFSVLSNWIQALKLRINFCCKSWATPKLEQLCRYPWASLSFIKLKSSWLTQNKFLTLGLNSPGAWKTSSVSMFVCVALHITSCSRDFWPFVTEAVSNIVEDIGFVLCMLVVTASSVLLSFGFLVTPIYGLSCCPPAYFSSDLWSTSGRVTQVHVCRRPARNHTIARDSVFRI